MASSVNKLLIMCWLAALPFITIPVVGNIEFLSQDLLESEISDVEPLSNDMRIIAEVFSRVSDSLLLILSQPIPTSVHSIICIIFCVEEYQRLRDLYPSLKSECTGWNFSSSYLSILSFSERLETFQKLGNLQYIPSFDSS
jgi:hypothetical protein